MQNWFKYRRLGILNMFGINDVYQNNDTGLLIRILDIDSDNNCYYIFIQDKLAAPKAIKVDDLEHQIHCGILAKRTDDPYSKIIDESSCSKAEIEKRDKAYKIIEKYLKNSKWEILKKRSRMDKFKTISNFDKTIIIQFCFKREIESKYKKQNGGNKSSNYQPK